MTPAFVFHYKSDYYYSRFAMFVVSKMEEF